MTSYEMTSDVMILITGSRDWTDESFIYNKLSIFSGKKVTILHGGCRGVDVIAESVGKTLGFNVIVKPAEWKKYGRGAGPIRNREMCLEALKSKEDGIKTYVIAFHDDVEKSKGTKNCINQAKKLGLEVIVYSHEQ